MLIYITYILIHGILTHGSIPHTFLSSPFISKVTHFAICRMHGYSTVNQLNLHQQCLLLVRWQRTFYERREALSAGPCLLTGIDQTEATEKVCQLVLYVWVEVINKKQWCQFTEVEIEIFFRSCPARNWGHVKLGQSNTHFWGWESGTMLVNCMAFYICWKHFYLLRISVKQRGQAASALQQRRWSPQLMQGHPTGHFTLVLWTRDNLYYTKLP